MGTVNHRAPNELKTTSTIRRIEGIDLVLIDQKIENFDGHVSNTNNNAHTISNITDLESALNSKVAKNDVTGSIDVVVEVDFVEQTVTKKTISYVDGQITSIV